MKSWILKKGATSLDDMVLAEVEKPVPAPGEVLIRIRACSINYRDAMIPRGQYMGGTIDRDITPLSDGAGEVEAVGAGVTHYKPGDRVAGIFSQGWISGPPHAQAGPALGAPPAKGMLAEYVTLPEHGVVRGRHRVECVDGGNAPSPPRQLGCGAGYRRCLPARAPDCQGGRRAGDRNIIIG
jgi:NADPH:quinone reductase-like Zn-dependent oxidoreductase